MRLMINSGLEVDGGEFLAKLMEEVFDLCFAFGRGVFSTINILLHKGFVYAHSSCNLPYVQFGELCKKLAYGVFAR